jgi:lysozyme
MALRLFASLLIIALLGCHRAPPPPQSPSPEQINAQGLSIIKDIEKLALKPYKLHGQWYVGYGHALEKPGSPITAAEAEHLLRKDLAICEDAIRQTVTAPVNTNEFSAMASLCYNMGVPSFAETSVVKRLNAGNRQGAADAFLLITKVETTDGEMKTLSVLKERREKERALFLTPATQTATNS